MKLLIVVMSCHKNWNLWKDIKRGIKKNFLIFTSSPKNENWYDENDKILYLNCRDTYESLPEKVICMIDQVLQQDYFKKYTHILKIDDYEAVKLTPEKIKNIYNFPEIERNDYTGQELLFYKNNRSARTYHYGKVSKESRWHDNLYKGTFVPWFNGGKSYILSRNAMECINTIYNGANIEVLRRYEIYEDLMIAKLLHKFSIFPVQVQYNAVEASGDE